MDRHKLPIFPFILVSLSIHLVLLTFLLNIEQKAPEADSVEEVKFKITKISPPEQGIADQKEIEPLSEPGAVETTDSTTKIDEKIIRAYEPVPPQKTVVREPAESVELPKVILENDSIAKMSPKSLIPSYDELNKIIDDYQKEHPDKSANVTMSIGDPNNLQYISYLTRIKRKIEAVFKYPPLARESRLTGVTNIFFIIEKNGSLGHIAMINSSNFKILDDGAMRALLKAAPFEPIPKEFDADEFRINGFFIYN